MNSNDFLIKMAESMPSDEAQLETAMGELPYEDIHEMGLDAGVANNTPEIDGTVDRFVEADQMGRELAHLHGEELQKEALLPLLAAGARAVAGVAKAAGPAIKKLVGRGGSGRRVARGLARDAVQDGVVNGVTQAARAPAQQTAQQADGVFKYAGAITRLRAETEFRKQAWNMGPSLKSVGATNRGNSVLRSVAGRAMRNPHMTAAAIGAGAGAVKGLVQDPGIDPATGQRRSRVGAMARNAAGGAVIGGAVSHIPGVSERIQGAGKGLSQQIRKTNWRNQSGGPAALRPAAPAGAVGGAAPAAASSAIAPAAAPAAAGHTAVNVPGGNAMPQYTPQMAQNEASDMAQAQGGLGGIVDRLRGRHINVPAEIQNPERVKLASLSSVERMKSLVEKRANMTNKIVGAVREDGVKSMLGAFKPKAGMTQAKPALPSMSGFKSIASSPGLFSGSAKPGSLPSPRR